MNRVETVLECRLTLKMERVSEDRNEAEQRMRSNI